MIEIREERLADVEAIRRVNREAFEQEQEGLIVDALRERGGVLLSLVAVVPELYPRFGFESATAFGLTCDWDLPAGVFMVRVPNPATAGRVHGHVTYRAEFGSA